MILELALLQTPYKTTAEPQKLCRHLCQGLACIDEHLNLPKWKIQASSIYVVRTGVAELSLEWRQPIDCSQSIGD
jgi:hypothetical protein